MVFKLTLLLLNLLLVSCGDIEDYKDWSVVKKRYQSLSSDVTRGYNAFYGSPVSLESSFDRGFQKQVFRYNIKDVATYDVEGYQVFPFSVCDVSFSKREISSSDEFFSFEASKTQTTVGFIAKRSKTVEKSKLESKLDQESQVLVRQEAQCTVLQYILSKFDPPMLSLDFVAALSHMALMLSQPMYTRQDIEREWHKVFDEFGTHYVSKMSTGSKITINTFMKSEVHKTYQKLSYSEKEQWSVDMLASYSKEESEETESSREKRKMSQDTTILTYGARPVSTGSALDWAATANFHPLPVEYELVPLFKIFNTFQYEKLREFQQQLRAVPHIKRYTGLDKLLAIEIWNTVEESFKNALMSYCTMRFSFWKLSVTDCKTSYHQLSSISTLFESRKIQGVFDIFVIPGAGFHQPSPLSPQEEHKIRSKVALNGSEETFVKVLGPNENQAFEYQAIPPMFTETGVWYVYTNPEVPVNLTGLTNVPILSFDATSFDQYPVSIDSLDREKSNRLLYILGDVVFWEKNKVPIQLSVRTRDKLALAKPLEFVQVKGSCRPNSTKWVPWSWLDEPSSKSSNHSDEVIELLDSPWAALLQIIFRDRLEQPDFNLDQLLLQNKDLIASTNSINMVDNIVCGNIFYEMLCPPNYDSLGLVVNVENFPSKLYRDRYRCIHDDFIFYDVDTLPQIIDKDALIGAFFNKSYSKKFVSDFEPTARLMSLFKKIKKRLLPESIKFIRNREGNRIDDPSVKYTKMKFLIESPKNHKNYYQQSECLNVQDALSKCTNTSEIQLEFHQTVQVRNINLLFKCAETVVALNITSFKEIINVHHGPEKKPKMFFMMLADINRKLTVDLFNVRLQNIRIRLNVSSYFCGAEVYGFVPPRIRQQQNEYDDYS